MRSLLPLPIPSLLFIFSYPAVFLFPISDLRPLFTSQSPSIPLSVPPSTHPSMPHSHGTVCVRGFGGWFFSIIMPSGLDLCPGLSLLQSDKFVACENFDPLSPREWTGCH